MSGAELVSARRVPGVAGSLEVRALVRYPDEAELSRVSFVGSVYGGPVVMVTAGNPGGVFVAAAVLERCGSLESTAPRVWVARFLGLEVDA